MSDEPTAEQLKKLKILERVSDEVAELTREAEKLHDAGQLTPQKLNLLEAKATKLVGQVGVENMPGWNEAFLQYRDELVMAPERAKLY